MFTSSVGPRPATRLGGAGLALTLCAAALSGSTTVHAQSVCISPAYGVPGLPGGPEWADYVPAGTKPTKPELDDPRWAGATRRYYPDSMVATADATLRAVKDGNILSLSLEALADTNANAADVVWVGIGRDDGEAGDADFYLLEIPLGGSLPVNAEVVPTTNWTAWTKQTAGSGSWTQDLGLGLVGTVVDTNQVRYWLVEGSSDRWAVNLKVDLSALGGTADLKLFTAVFIETSFGSGAIHQWPASAVSVGDPVVNFDQSAIAVSGWGDTTFGSYSSPCADGISLAWNQVGAEPAPDGLIYTPTSTPAVAENTFFARPNWNGAAPTNGKIKARFRMANWGSTVTDRPNAPWDDIDLPNVWFDNVGTEVTHACTISATGTTLCQGVLPAGSDDHQCLLVTLDKGSAADPTDLPQFAVSSVYRNMNFDIASKLERLSEISVQGLEPLSGTHRDVYIHVSTANMPEHGPGEIYLDREGMEKGLAVMKSPQKPKPKVDKGSLKRGQLPPPLDPDQALDVYGHMMEAWPTYEVRVAHDTGRQIVVRGKKYKLLESQLPYGLFVTHQGALYGWEHTLQGVDGAELERLAANYYRVKVPHKGSVKLKSTIVAHDKPGKRRCDCKDCCAPPAVNVNIKGCYCRTAGATTGDDSASRWLLSLLPALVLIARRRKRARVLAAERRPTR